MALDGISENMDSHMKTCKYGAINTTDTKIMVYYVINMCCSHLHYKKKNDWRSIE